jgi:hypothetical protein
MLSLGQVKDGEREIALDAKHPRDDGKKVHGAEFFYRI